MLAATARRSSSVLRGAARVSLGARSRISRNRASDRFRRSFNVVVAVDSPFSLFSLFSPTAGGKTPDDEKASRSASRAKSHASLETSETAKARSMTSFA